MYNLLFYNFQLGGFLVSYLNITKHGGCGVCLLPFNPGCLGLTLSKYVVLGFIGNFNQSWCLSSWQAFYPVEHPVDVSFGDILAARCVFTGEGRTEATRIG